MNLLPSPWVALAVVLAVGGAYIAGEITGDRRGEARVQQAWDRSDRQVLEARAKRVEASRQREQGLQANANRERENLEKEARRLARELDIALYELRNRPPRPTGFQPGGVPASVAGTAGEVGGCTGAGLYRDDAEFLARQAHLAQLIRAERNTCYRLYNEAREKLSAPAP